MYFFLVDPVRSLDVASLGIHVGGSTIDDSWANIVVLVFGSGMLCAASVRQQRNPFKYIFCKGASSVPHIASWGRHRSRVRSHADREKGMNPHGVVRSHKSI